MSEARADTDGKIETAEVKIREWFVQATAFHKATLLTEAAALYEQILELAPGHSATLHLLGVLRHAQRNFGEAVRLIGAAVAAAPENPSYHAALGAALRGADRTEEALAAYDRAVALRPDFAEAHNHRAVALQHLGRLEAAIEAYRTALAQRPDYAEAYNNLGTALRRAGRGPEAMAAYRSALVHRPNYVDALGNLGKLEIEQGQKLAAVETYERLLALRADDIDALEAMGNLLVVLDRDEEALGYYTAALDLRPRDPGLLDRLAVALLVIDRFGEALALLDTAVRIDPSLASVQLHYGIALEKAGRVEDALVAMRAAAALDPTLQLVHYTLGMLCLAIGAYDEARSTFADWYRREPEHPTARHMMAALSGTDVPSRASASYIVDTFDTFAKTFDRQLERLEYRGPQLVDGLLRAHAALGGPTLAIADLGCGTGLCAPFIRPFARRLAGVDLSAEMLDRARRRGLYDELVEADLIDFLAARPAAFDLIVAADTFIYFGDLAPLFELSAGALRPNGHFAFTLEDTGSDRDASYVLGPSGRYQHAQSYVRDRLAAAGLRVVALEPGVVRTEASQPVPGHIVLAERPAAR